MPVGKAYFGFTDEELQPDRQICARQHDRALRPGALGARRAAVTGWCWRSPSRGSTVRRATGPASPCAFPAFRGSAGTSRRRRPTASSSCRPCWRSARARRLLADRHLDFVDVDRLAGIVDVGVDGDGAFGARRLVRQHRSRTGTRPSRSRPRSACGRNRRARRNCSRPRSASACLPRRGRRCRTPRACRRSARARPWPTSKTMADPDAPERMRMKSPESSFITSALVSAGALTLVGSDGLNTRIQSRSASASPGLAGASSSPGTKASSSGGGWTMSFSSGAMGSLTSPVEIPHQMPMAATAISVTPRKIAVIGRRRSLATLGPPTAETSSAIGAASSIGEPNVPKSDASAKNGSGTGRPGAASVTGGAGRTGGGAGATGT